MLWGSALLTTIFRVPILDYKDLENQEKGQKCDYYYCVLDVLEMIASCRIRVWRHSESVHSLLWTQVSRQMEACSRIWRHGYCCRSIRFLRISRERDPTISFSNLVGGKSSLSRSPHPVSFVTRSLERRRALSSSSFSVHMLGECLSALWSSLLWKVTYAHAS